MFNQKLTLILVAFATTFSMVPALAFARDGSDDVKSTQQERQQEHKNILEDRKGFALSIHEDSRSSERSNASLAPRGVVRGSIITKTAIGFTLKGRKNSVITVDTSTAVITKIPNQTILLVDLVVGDYVSVKGVKTGLNVVATNVYMVPANLYKAQVKGTVTAVSGNIITVQTKKGKIVTVNADSNTVITNKLGLPATMSDIIVSSKLKISGIWDSILNIFTALKIHIK